MPFHITNDMMQREEVVVEMESTGTLGSRLRRARHHRGWTQDRLATESGVGIATIRRAEGGQFEPRQETARRLATALKVRTAWLTTGDGSMDVEEP